MPKVSFNIGESLKYSADMYPEHIAVSTTNSVGMSFGSLEDKSNRLAKILISCNIHKGDRVGIFTSKSPEQVIGIYGVAKAGGVFVLLNHKLKKDQIVYVCNNCNIKLLITDSICIQIAGNNICSETSVEKVILTDKSSAQDNTAFCCFEDALNIEMLPGELPKVIGEDTASIIYTSGSTGKPKGVVVTHRNIIDGADIVSRYLGLCEKDRVLSLLPFSFDYGLNQVISSIKYGAQIYLSDFVFEMDVFNAIQEFKITGLAGVPTIWIKLANFPYSKNFNVSSLRYITNSGGKISKNYVYKLIEMFPRTDIYLMYGLTESFRSTFLLPSIVKEKPESIGRAIPNVEIYILNAKGQLCKPGEKGEIVHRGALISQGYWDNPEATDKIIRHIKLPNMPIKEKVVFSGDEGYLDEDGDLYFLGRKDEMIKSSGYRISPTEIEEVLYGEPGVEGAVAWGVEDVELGQRIKVVIQTRLDVQEITDRIKRLCAVKLPVYMQPHLFEVTSSMPITSSGKIDRSKIKQLYGKV